MDISALINYSLQEHYWFSIFFSKIHAMAIWRELNAASFKSKILCGLQASAYNCPIIDCGDPTSSIPTGAQIVGGGTVTNTRYNESFTIACSTNFQQVSVNVCVSKKFYWLLKTKILLYSTSVYSALIQGQYYDDF